MQRLILQILSTSILLSSALFNHVYAQSYSIKLSDKQTNTLATLIWQNEGAGKTEFLTVWNKNENFPSLGIGHFIWYPTSNKGPYIEQFPQLLNYLQENNIQIPEWLTEAKVAPWKSREMFYDAFESNQLTQLRSLLHSTIGLQARFIIKRLERGIPAILESSDEIRVWCKEQDWRYVKEDRINGSEDQCVVLLGDHASAYLESISRGRNLLVVVTTREVVSNNGT